KPEPEPELAPEPEPDPIPEELTLADEPELEVEPPVVREERIEEPLKLAPTWPDEELRLSDEELPTRAEFLDDLTVSVAVEEPEPDVEAVEEAPVEEPEPVAP